MEREIKFKYIYTDGKHSFVKVFTLSDIEQGLQFDEISDSPLLKDYRIVCRFQYTGLKDKNDVDIYDCDIIKQTSSDGEDFIHIIGYENYEARFVAYFKIDYHTDMSFCGLVARWTDKKEVIGNIYENPELLEEKK
jgi:hypothetical protein